LPSPRKRTLIRLIHTLAVELRRIASLLLIPWIGASFLCIISSWYLISIVGLDAVLAPVLKAIAFIKPFSLQLLKVVSAFFLWIWLHTFVKFSAWVSEFLVLVFAYVGGIKAWSLKKFLRQLLRFVVTFTTRIFLISIVLNLLFGQERKGVKQVPGLVVTRFKQSRFNHILLFWHNKTERQKRLFFGVVLCLVLVVAGHTLLGLSILLFDLIWELAIIAARLIARFWRLVWPLMARFIPNAIGNFFTNKVLPFCADLLPVIKNDQRVMYLRFNIRHHFRNLKAYLYRKSRSKRQSIRGNLRPYVSERIRESKTKILEKAVSNADREE